MSNNRYYLLWIITFFILVLSFLSNIKSETPNNLKHYGAEFYSFILPYKGDLWIVSKNGKIIDIVEDYKLFEVLPIITIPEKFIDYFSGKINQDFFKKIPKNIPSFIYEINFKSNYFVLSNNSKIYFNENFDFHLYFEKLKIVYNYIEPGKIYYISKDTLVKAR